MSKSTPNAMVVQMADALRSAKRVLAAERRSQFECFTIPPDRSYDHMNNTERRAIRRFDRAIAKINEALQ